MSSKDENLIEIRRKSNLQLIGGITGGLVELLTEFQKRLSALAQPRQPAETSAGECMCSSSHKRHILRYLPERHQNRCPLRPPDETAAVYNVKGELVSMRPGPVETNAVESPRKALERDYVSKTVLPDFNDWQEIAPGKWRIRYEAAEARIKELTATTSVGECSCSPNWKAQFPSKDFRQRGTWHDLQRGCPMYQLAAPPCRRCRVLYRVECRARQMACGCCRWCVLVDVEWHKEWSHE